MKKTRKMSLGLKSVIGIISMVVVLGAILAARLGAGFVMCRKPGKLPGMTRKASYKKEYGFDIEYEDGAFAVKFDLAVTPEDGYDAADELDIILDDVVGKSSLPTPNMDRVVVTRCIQKDDNFVYTTVIYNADGSPYLEVEMTERTNFHYGNSIPDSPSFIADIGWTKDAQDNYSMIVELNGTCDPCWEYMKFDPITGTFGESIGHGSF